MLQQIPQPFVMATFISTILIPIQSLYQAQRRQREEGRKEEGEHSQEEFVEVK